MMNSPFANSKDRVFLIDDMEYYQFCEEEAYDSFTEKIDKYIKEGTIKVEDYMSDIESKYVTVLKPIYTKDGKKTGIKTTILVGKKKELPLREIKHKEIAIEEKTDYNNIVIIDYIYKRNGKILILMATIKIKVNNGRKIVESIRWRGRKDAKIVGDHIKKEYDMYVPYKIINRL